MLTARVQITTDYSVGFKHYGAFTYVTILTEARRNRSWGKSKSMSRKKCSEDSYCITRKLYEKNQFRPFFFIDRVSREDKFEAVSSVFFKAYQNGLGWKADHSDRTIDMLAALKKGKFERIVKNRYDNNHTLLDHNGEIIYHRVRLDYTNGALHGGSYDLSKLKKHLQKRKDIVNISEIEIPYYNSSYNGEKALEFTYVPPNWDQFVAWYYPDTFSARYELYGKLGVDKYRLED